MIYNELVEACFFAPNHVGVIDLSQPLSVHYRGGFAHHGDVFDFYLRCNRAGKIQQACFKAYGNPYLIAGAEWVCQQLEGSLIDEHPQFDYLLLIEQLGIPKNRYPVAIQIEEGYKQLVKRMKETIMSEVTQHISTTTPDITLSEAALQHVLSYLKQQANNQGIRLSVKKTGCSGLSYVIDYVQTPLDSDIAQPLAEGFQIWVDKASYRYLKGMAIDYVKQGLNSKFVFTNPNQTGQCGCGESFTV